MRSISPSGEGMAAGWSHFLGVCIILRSLVPLSCDTISVLVLFLLLLLLLPLHYSINPHSSPFPHPLFTGVANAMEAESLGHKAILLYWTSLPQEGCWEALAMMR